MNKLRGIRRVGLATAKLTDEEILYIDKKIVETVRPLLIGRTLFPLANLGHAGYRTVYFYTQSDMSAAVIDMEGQQESMDDVPLTPHTVTVPVLHKEFRLLWRDIAMKREAGLPLDVQHAQNAARQVAEEEDKLLLSGQYTGWAALGIEGLMTATGRLTVVGGDWSANCLTYVANAIAALEAEGFYGPYKLILTPAWRAQLRAADANLHQWLFKSVGDLIGGVENILVSSSLFASDGGVDRVCLCQPGEDNFDLVVGEDAHTRTHEEKTGNIWGQVREVLAPRIKQPKSICEINALT